MRLFKPNISKMYAKNNVSGLIKAISDKDKNICIEAIEALGDIGDKLAVEQLIAALKDPDRDIRRSAIKSLDKLGDSRAVEPLIAAIGYSTCWDSFDNGDAIHTLEKIIDINAIEPLVAALSDLNYKSRWRIPKLLEKIGDDRVVEPLIAALKDPNETVRECAAESLKKFNGDKRIVKPLLEALRDSSAYVRKSVVNALRDVEDERVAIPLLDALRDEDESVRGVAFIFLEYNAKKFFETIDKNLIIEAVLPSLKVNDSEVFMAVIKVLGELGDNKIVKPIVSALMNKDILFTAQNEWRKLSDYQEIANILIKLEASSLPDSTPIPIQVYFAIKKLDWNKVLSFGKNAVEPLIELLKFPEFKAMAIQILGELGDGRAIEPLLQTMRISNQYGDNNIYTACKKSLQKMNVNIF